MCKITCLFACLSELLSSMLVQILVQGSLILADLIGGAGANQHSIGHRSGGMQPLVNTLNASDRILHTSECC